MTAPELIAVLSPWRFPLVSEKACQARIAEVLEASAVPFSREHRLGPCDIPDFLVGGIAVEVKLKGRRRDIFRQLERYAAYAEVAEILLATAIFMGLPREIAGKPAWLFNLSKAWL